MVVFVNVIKPQGLEPLQFPTKFRSPSPMQLNDQAVYEYACHEGNYGLYNILAGARAEETAAETAAQGSK